jgi:hypothetical protein
MIGVRGQIKDAVNVRILWQRSMIIQGEHVFWKGIFDLRTPLEHLDLLTRGKTSQILKGGYEK